MKAPDIDIEKWRAALCFLADSWPPSSDCVDAEQFWAAAHGDPKPAQLRRLLDHASLCPSCSEAWRLARQLISQLEEAGEKFQQPRSFVFPRARVYWTAFAVAAAMVAIIAGVRFYQPQTMQPGAEFRDPSQQTILSLVDEQVLLSRTDCLLRWSPGPEGTLYSIQVATEDLTVIAQARSLERPEYVVAKTALEDLPAEATIIWQVKAQFLDGSSLRSKSFVNRIE